MDMSSLYVLKVVVGLVLGYLSGSVNYAIIVTRLVAGRDIRELGNRNPGTANVARSIGKGWATVVFFADLLKGFLAMLLVRCLLQPHAGSAAQTLAVAAVGIAAIAGHCKPVFFGFRGGGGIATAIGVYLFLIPVEIFVSMLVGFGLVSLFVRSPRYRLGRWTPIMFVTLAPFLTLVTSRLVNIPLTARVSVGGHPWHVIVGVFAISLFLVGMNLRVLGETFREQPEGTPPPGR
jgi:glycerol-3-phosphate acyltransferase PlsY